MKPQDIVFFAAVVLLFFFRKQKLFLYAGLVSLIVAIPLFAKWIFFTAERFTWYASAFFLIYLLGFFVRRNAVK